MEKLIDKLKTQSIIVGILLIISATWVIIDYFVLIDIKDKFELDFGINWMLLIISGIAILAFHLAVFILLFFNIRIFFKNRSNLKKEKKQNDHVMEGNTDNE